MSGVLFRRIVFFGGLLLVLIGTIPFSKTASVGDLAVPRVLGFFCMALGAGIAQGFFPPVGRWRNRAGWLLLMVVFVLPRILLLPASPSDDVHRYRWEGRLVAEGQNPFAATADDLTRAPWRDADWEQMNHRDRGTIYPPLAQLIFGGMAVLEEWIPRLWLDKGIILACDFGIFLLVLVLLRRRQLPPSWSLFYAINPVVLVSFAAEAHYDALFILPLTGAVVALESGRKHLSWILLAASIQIKLMSLVLVPVWLLRGAWKGVWLGIVVVAVTWVPFFPAFPVWAESLFHFGGSTAFFGLIPWLLRITGLNPAFAAGLGGGLFLIFLAIVLWKGGSTADQVRRLLGALLVCSPILHFWYLAWLAPFLALRPSLTWLWLCAAQGFYFLVWQTEADTGVWALPDGVEAVVWIPFLLLAAIEGWRLLRRRSWRATGSDKTLGVVIPAFNAGSFLQDCLESIESSTRKPEQVVVVDGGSTDATVEIAQRWGAQVVQAPLGRGSQIKRGIESLDTDWVLVVHADCRLHPEVLEAIGNLDGFVIGGCCGQRFSPSGPILSWVEFMNEGRAVHGESYWGDQGQFFRRNATCLWKDLEDFPLMEDVELSIRLRRNGETRYLGLETSADTKKWQKGGRFSRIVLVFDTVIRYRWARFWGREKDNARKLYARYYGQPVEPEFNNAEKRA